MQAANCYQTNTAERLVDLIALCNVHQVPGTQNLSMAKRRHGTLLHTSLTAGPIGLTPGVDDQHSNHVVATPIAAPSLCTVGCTVQTVLQCYATQSRLASNQNNQQLRAAFAPALPPPVTNTGLGRIRSSKQDTQLQLVSLLQLQHVRSDSFACLQVHASPNTHNTAARSQDGSPVTRWQPSVLGCAAPK